MIDESENREGLLVRVDDAGEVDGRALAAIRLGQQVHVLREQHPAERGRSIKQVVVVEFSRTVLLHSQDHHATPAESARDRFGHVDIHAA